MEDNLPLYAQVEVPVNEIGIAVIAIGAVATATYAVTRKASRVRAIKNFAWSVRHPIDAIFVPSPY